ncbi:Cytochrome c, mono-and diheme variants [Rhizobiales bacterium GAS113]|jgi:mono/diheme cytochrome c family protein|nr:Cytochrome c, mono-and diheme variants [Rhizobiales bacterium GAS113]
MIRRLVIAAALAGLVGLGVFWVLTAPQTIAASTLGPHQIDLANGKSMFEAGGCASCHATPGQADRSQLGGGLALRSPFGTFYVPNISPELQDGIGSWTEAQFVTALNKGTSPDGRHYYPALPYTSYQEIKIDDLRDLFAYIKTLPPIQGKVRGHDLPFPFTIRRGIGLWKLLFLDGKSFEPDPSKGAAWNRGAYLVNGPGHCAECHSPRNILGAVIASQRFAGGPNPDGRGFVPNITQLALKDWSEQDIADLLETGQTPDGDFVGSSMNEEVRGTRQLSPDDRAAIATYIKSLQPVEGPKPPSKKP